MTGGRRSPGEGAGVPRLVWKPVQAVRTFLGRAPLADGYVTLAVVDAERRESQLGRLDTTNATEPAQTWLIRLVNSHMEIADDARFRVRRWGPGGKAAGSASFRVSKAQGVDVRPVSVRPPDTELLKRLTAMERAMDALRGHVGRLETKLEAAENAIEAMQPVIDAAEQALLILGESDDED